MCGPSGALMYTSSSGRPIQMVRKVLSGNDGEVVLALPECTAHLFGDPNHAEGKARQQNLLVERIDVREQLFHQILTDHADAGIVLEIGVVDVTPNLHLFAADIGKARRHPVHRDLVDQTALVTRRWIGGEVGHGADLLVPLQVVP